MEITIPPPLIQQYQRYIARSVVSNYLNPYFKLEAISTIMTADAKSELKKQLGERWPRYYRKYRKAFQLAGDMKFYYDALHSREIYKKDQKHPLARKARTAYHKIPLVMAEVDDIHMRLLKLIPSLGNLKIPSDYFQKERRKSTTYDDYEDENDYDE